MKNTIATLAVAVLLGACAADEPADETATQEEQVAAAAPQEMIVTTRDYAFEAPDTVLSGVTTIRLRNQGPEPHHVQLVRIDEGKTLEDVMAALAAGGPPPAWAVDVGGPNTPWFPEQETNATVDLQPGNYVMLCFIPSPDGTPHVMKGMVKELTVVPNPGAPATMPEADLVMTLADYSYATDKAITAGTRTIRVENTAAQAHEVFFVRLEEGRTPEDFIGFIEGKVQGPPPGAIVGGITGIAPGQANVFTMDFEPGEYAMLCFLADAKDGRPHVAHGMVQTITVS